MESFTIAHLNIQNVNVVIVFLNEAFDRQPDDEKHRINNAFQLCARSANLAGNVVPVWMDASGNTKFMAPQNQHAFFQSVSYHQLLGQANKTLKCGE